MCYSHLLVHIFVFVSQSSLNLQLTILGSTTCINPQQRWGPIAWKSIPQVRMALSSWCSRNCRYQWTIGSEYIKVYNDNRACVQWSTTTLTIGTKHKHISLERALFVNWLSKSRQIHTDICHIHGVINPAERCHLLQMTPRLYVMCSKESYFKYLGCFFRSHHKRTTITILDPITLLYMWSIAIVDKCVTLSHSFWPIK